MGRALNRFDQAWGLLGRGLNWFDCSDQALWGLLGRGLNWFDWSDQAWGLLGRGLNWFDWSDQAWGLLGRGLNWFDWSDQAWGLLGRGLNWFDWSDQAWGLLGRGLNWFGWLDWSDQALAKDRVGVFLSIQGVTEGGRCLILHIPVGERQLVRGHIFITGTLAHFIFSVKNRNEASFSEDKESYTLTHAHTDSVIIVFLKKEGNHVPLNTVSIIFLMLALGGEGVSKPV